MSQSEDQEKYGGEDPSLPWVLGTAGLSMQKQLDTVPVSPVQLLRIAARYHLMLAINDQGLTPYKTISVRWWPDWNKDVSRFESCGQLLSDFALMEETPDGSLIHRTAEALVADVAQKNPLVAVCVYGLLVGITHLRLSPGLAAAVEQFGTQKEDGP